MLLYIKCQKVVTKNNNETSYTQLSKPKKVPFWGGGSRFDYKYFVLRKLLLQFLAYCALWWRPPFVIIMICILRMVI